MTELAVRPASTVVLLRDSAAGPELLLVRRNRALAFAGGFWVFPGGAVDAEDRAAAQGDADRAARLAAAREAREEAGLQPDAARMVLISHWTTPLAEPKRFATWIFAAPVAADAEVSIDNGEIHEARWMTVAAALDQHRQGTLPLMPPTFITLCALRRYRNVEAVIEGERQTPCPKVLPRLLPTETQGGFITLYPGDVAYECGEPEQPGPRHRAYLADGCWHYQYERVVDAAPLYPLE